MGGLAHFTPFHRNKGGLAAFQEDRGEQKLHSPAKSHAPPGLQPFPLSPKASCSLPCECQNCDLHGKAAKVGTMQGWWAHLGHWETPGKRRSSDHLPTWLPTISRAGQKQPIFPPLAEEMPFKDPTSLAGGLQFCHQTCQWAYSINYSWGTSRHQMQPHHLLQSPSLEGQGRRAPPGPARSCWLQQEWAAKKLFPERQAAVISSPEMSVQNTWHIILLGSFVFNCISKRDGVGGKRLLTFVQEEAIRYKERKSDFFTAPANSYLLPNEVLVQTLNVVQWVRKATGYWVSEKCFPMPY